MAYFEYASGTLCSGNAFSIFFWLVQEIVVTDLYMKGHGRAQDRFVLTGNRLRSSKSNILCSLMTVSLNSYINKRWWNATRLVFLCVNRKRSERPYSFLPFTTNFRRHTNSISLDVAWRSVNFKWEIDELNVSLDEMERWEFIVETKLRTRYERWKWIWGNFLNKYRTLNGEYINKEM